jgi:hypothetical protein
MRKVFEEIEIPTGLRVGVEMAGSSRDGEL